MSGVVGNVIGTGIKMLHYETGINECEHVETDSTFDLESYISASWYPQFMNEQYYQRIEDYLPQKKISFLCLTKTCIDPISR